jgi:lactate permease
VKQKKGGPSLETNLPLHAGSLLLSALPLVVITIVILRLRWTLLKASIMTCFSAIILAFAYFGVGTTLMINMIGKGFAFAVFIGIILVTAIFLYNLLTELGIMDSMGQRLLFLKNRPLLQVLFLAWCFSGFIEGFIGFGIPVVLIAPFLIIGGLTPFQAVALTLVGHAWAVTYGTLGVALYTLSLSSRIPISELSYAMATQFTLMFTLSGFAVAHLYGGWKSARQGSFSILAAGATASAMFSCVQDLT